MAKIRLSGIVNALSGTANGITVSNGQYGAIVQATQRTRRGMGRMKWPSYQDLITRYNDVVIGDPPKSEPTLQQLMKYMPIALLIEKTIGLKHIHEIPTAELMENAKAIVKLTVNLKGGFFTKDLTNSYGYPLPIWEPGSKMSYALAKAIVERYLLLRAIYGITIAAATFSVTAVATAASIGVCYANLKDFTIPMYIQALRLDKMANGIKFLAGYQTNPKELEQTPKIEEKAILPGTTHIMCWYKICTSSTSNNSGRGWQGGKSLGAGLGPIVDLAHNAFIPREALFCGNRIWLTVGSCDEVGGGISWWGTGFVGGKS